MKVADFIAMTTINHTRNCGKQTVKSAKQLRDAGFASTSNHDSAISRNSVNLPKILGMLLTPLPLFPIQPVLHRIVTNIAAGRPELFERLGPHIHSTFVIEVRELPFVLCLIPDPDKPILKAARRSDHIGWDAKISGNFVELFAIMDGTADSDALFFSRDIEISGNTEAVVCLRGALDDLEGSIVGDLLKMRDPLLLPVRMALSAIHKAGRG